MIWGAALAALLAQTPPAQGSPAPASTQTPAAAERTYVDGFCMPVAGGYASGQRFYGLLTEWKARPGSSAEGAALKPEGTTTAGQLMKFDAPDAPSAFVDTRSGECTLVWPRADLPPAELRTIAEGSLPTGLDGAARRWRRVTAVFAGRPRPPKWLMPIGDRDGEGVCAVAETELNRRDGHSASLLRLSPCRLAADETLQSQ